MQVRYKLKVMKGNRSRIVSHSILLAAVALPFIVLGKADAATNFVRELAKNKPRVYILTSGPQAAEVGNILQTTLLHHQDNKHKAEEYPVLSLADAEKAAQTPQFNDASVVCLLVGSEQKELLPLALAAILPLSSEETEGTISVVKAAQSRGAHKGTAYDVVMRAPDVERLKRVFRLFLERSAEKYDQLAFSESFRTNKLAVFSAPEDRDFAEGWGTISDRHVWNDVQWFPFSDREKLAPEQLAERSEVYFFDRSRADATVPAPAAKLLGGQTLQPTTCLIAHSDGEDGASVVVFSAPTDLILRKKASKCGNLGGLARMSALTEVVDLRKIGRTTLVVYGGDLSKDQKDQIRGQIAGDMRQKLKMDIEERGSVLDILQSEVTLESLQGASDSAKKLRRKASLNYIWLFQILSSGGGTDYQVESRKVSPEPPAFSEPEPSEPSRRKYPFGPKKSDDVYNREMSEWRDAHSRWESKKEDYDRDVQYNATYEYERTALCLCKASITGKLMLVDLQDSGKVLWEKQCEFQATDSKPYRSDHVSVRGLASRPDSIETPPSSNEFPLALMQQAAYQAAGGGLDSLQEDAWLPDANAPVPPPEPVVEKSSGEDRIKKANLHDGGGEVRKDDSAPQVAAINGNVVTLTIGSDEGVHTGDRINVVTKTREVRNPTTGELMETVVDESLKFRVTRVGKTADAVLASPQDAAKLQDVKVGMSIRRIPSSPRVPSAAPSAAPSATPKPQPHKRTTAPRRRR